MKKILGIIVLGLLLSGCAYSDQRCTQERQNWIVHIKKQLEKRREEAERMKQEIDSDRKIFEKKIRRGKNQGLAYLIDPKEKY